jgi:predicted small secreted protein
MMKNPVTARLVIIVALAGLAAGCANTIRGVGQDTANAVNATQSAGHKIDRAAKY